MERIQQETVPMDLHCKGPPTHVELRSTAPWHPLELFARFFLLLLHPHIRLSVRCSSSTASTPEGITGPSSVGRATSWAHRQSPASSTSSPQVRRDLAHVAEEKFLRKLLKKNIVPNQICIGRGGGSSVGSFRHDVELLYPIDGRVGTLYADGIDAATIRSFPSPTHFMSQLCIDMGLPP